LKNLSFLWLVILTLIVFIAVSPEYCFSREGQLGVQMSLDWIHEKESLLILAGAYSFKTNHFYISTPDDTERLVHIFDGNTGEDLGTGLNTTGLSLADLNIFGLCVDDAGVIYGGVTDYTPHNNSLIRWDNETADPTQQYIPSLGISRVMDIKNSGTNTIIAITGSCDGDSARILKTLDGKNFNIDSETFTDLGKHGIALAKTGERVYLTQAYLGYSNLFTRADKIGGEWIINTSFTPPADLLGAPSPLGYWDEANILFCISTKLSNNDHLFALDGDTGAIIGDLPLGLDVGLFGFGAIDLQGDADSGNGGFVGKRERDPYYSGYFCGKFHFQLIEMTPTPTPTSTPIPLTLLCDLTPYGDLWGAECHGIPPFDTPYRRGWLGFKFDPENHWYPLKGNADADGIEDIIQVTEYGDAWVSICLDTLNLSPTRWGWLGFRFEETTYNGWIPVAGDANGDGADDLIQVTEWGDAWVALSMETMYNPPTRWGWLGFEFSRGEVGNPGAIPLTGDANGDGYCDLIQITQYGDAWVALSAETIYNPPTRWGWLGFKYAPFDGWYPLCGDMNADGLDDLVQITPTGDPWVALAGESLYNPPTRWGWLNFYYDETQGYYPLLGDVNADGKEDLIQITPGGEQWVSLSTGEAFETPEQWGWLGFIFSREKGYLPFYLEY